MDTTYLLVNRMDDGRYRVVFMKPGQSPRTSYSRQSSEVVRQAQRAGNIPVCTADPELQRACEQQQVLLLAVSHIA